MNAVVTLNPKSQTFQPRDLVGQWEKKTVEGITQLKHVNLERKVFSQYPALAGPERKVYP